MSAEVLIGTIAVSLIILTAGFLSDILGIPWIYCWLFSVNLWSFIIYGYDKARAIAGRYRVPNKVLLLIAVLGGGVGSIIGIYTFRHKTLMDRFQYYIYFIMSIQALAYYFFFK